MESCEPKCVAMKMLIIGVILILVRLFTSWDIWVVLGAILVLKGILLLIKPMCPCHGKCKK
ncbi:hypothetical protein HN385_02015 [archaeon]|jgi:membrane-bound ClpP family serine protease|nr:hypothetical protein [archaeon]MBT3450329.1 hypothetical protein [archaeon]MBT6868896.1 hypothetical protein [archaeon]MBT7192883.1 hypothetical protein [archaeon]MBT7380849.1 hypothetical protein [archaeon]